MQNRSFHARHELHHACIAHILDEPVNDVVSQLTMRHLAATEAQARLHLVAFMQKAHCLVFLRLVVVLVYRDRELHFLDRDDLLLFAGGALALFFLVEISAVILNATDWRDGVWRYLD